MGNPARGAAVNARGLNHVERGIVDNVANHGCSIMSVFDPDGIEPDFSYSIGFPETTGQSEVIVFSLPKALRASMINEIYRQLSEEEASLCDEVELADLIEGFTCVAREISDRRAIEEHFGSAIWYNERYRGQSIEKAFQIVWPGAQQGLFPWEEGCVQSVIDDQPALYDIGMKQ